MHREFLSSFFSPRLLGELLSTSKLVIAVPHIACLLGVCFKAAAVQQPAP